MKKSLARVPLLVPFLFVAACTTSPDDAQLSVATVEPAAAEAEPATPRKGRRKLDRIASARVTPETDLQARQSPRQDSTIASEIAAFFQRGRASWYGPGFEGRRTASGERFEAGGMTAAHRSLPFGTRVRVTHAATGRSVVVRINDRGPFHGGRIIDLAAGPARMLGLTSAGSAYVSLHRLD